MKKKATLFKLQPSIKRKSLYEKLKICGKDI